MKHDSRRIIEQDPKRMSPKDEYIARRGWWAPFRDDFLLLDVQMFRTLLAFSTVPWKKGFIEPKVKKFNDIAIAIDEMRAAATLRLTT